MDDSNDLKINDLLQSLKIRLNANPGEIFLLPGETKITVVLLVIVNKFYRKLTGTLTITNIRVIWQSQNDKNINIIIPIKYIEYFEEAPSVILNHKQRSEIHIRTKEGSEKNVFMFSLRKPIKKTISLLYKVIQNFNTSTLLREMSLRSAIISNQRLDLLQTEYVLKSFEGLVNIIKRTGKVGVGILTNLRFVWYSTIVENFNISVPLIIIPEVTLVNHTRFQHSFYIRIENNHKTLLFGFTFGKVDVLEDFINSLNRTRETALLQPMLTYPTHGSVSNEDDDIFGSQNNDNDNDTNSLMDGNEESFQFEDNDPMLQFFDFDKEENDPMLPIVYDQSIGLSIEQSSLQTSVSNLWELASKSKFKTLAEL